MPGFGLRPITGDLAVAPPKWFSVADSYAGNIFSGDFVERLANGTVQRQNTTTGVSPIVTTTPTLGVAVGFQYTDTQGRKQFSNYYPAAGGTAIKAMVCQDPNQLYIIQSDGNTVLADVGINFIVGTFAASAGSTVTGNSGITLVQASNVITAATTCGRIIGLVYDGANEFLTSSKNVIVKLHTAVLSDSVTVGI